MSNSILKIKYYKNGQFKGSEGVSIFQNSNLQSTLQFKFDEDLGDASVVANILIPYAEGDPLYGQHQKQSLFMRKQTDPAGGYIYSSEILRGYLANQGKAYVNAQVYAADGYIDVTNTGNGIVVAGIAYWIGYVTETIGGVSVNLLVLEDSNTGRVFNQQQEGIIVLENGLVCLIKQFEPSLDGNGLFNGTLRLTSGIEVKNYQQVEFKITASAPYYVDYPMTIEESYLVRQELARAQSDITAAQADILLKQDKVDPNINEDGVDHSVVGNINDLIDRADTDEGDIGTLQGQMATAQQDIADLQRIVGYGINIVGTMTTQDALPSDQDVSDYVISITGEAPTRGLAVIVKVDYTSGTDEIYFYVYDGTNWHHFEMQFLNDAENGVKGLIQGNYNAADTTPGKLMVSIVSGEVAEIYYNDVNGVRRSLTNVLADVVEKVINGTSPVKMAEQDKNGNDIPATYLTKAEGASKVYVQDYAEPKALFEINYPDYATGVFKENNVSDNSYNKTINSASVGYTTLDVLTTHTKADILLGKQNGTRNRIWILSTYTEGVKLRITTEYQKPDLTYGQLAVSVTDTLSFVPGIPVLVTIDSVFSGLSTPITLPANTELRQTIEVWREDGTSADYTLLCNTTYDAYMELSKIGYARYVFEEEPTAIESGHDSSPTIDSDGDLQVASDGQIHYANGSSAPLTIIEKIPIDNGLADPTSILPARAGQVASRLADRANKLVIADPYDPTHTYHTFDTVEHDGKCYYCYPSDNVTGAWDSTKWVMLDMGALYLATRNLDNNKLNKVTSTSTNPRVYMIGTDGSQQTFQTSANADTYTIPVRDGSGSIAVSTPLNLPDYAQYAVPKSYVDGKSLSAGAKAFVESEYDKTLNLWNEQWEVGVIASDGTIDSSETSRRTTSLIKIEPNTQYHISNAFTYGRYAYYDQNGALVSYDGNGFMSQVITTPSGVAYMRITLSSSYGTTYNHDLIVSKGSEDIAYQPYNGAIVHEKEFQDRTQKSLYNLGAFDSVTDNGNGTVTITRKTGYARLEDLSWNYLGGVWYEVVNLNGYSNAVHSKASNYKTYTDKSYSSLASGELTTYYTDFSVNPNIIVNTGSSTTKPSGLFEYELPTATTQNLIKDEQANVRAEVDTFDQLVQDQYINFTNPASSVTEVCPNGLIANHKYYINVKLASSDTFVLGGNVGGTNTNFIVTTANINEIRVQDVTSSNIFVWTQNALGISNFKIIDLTDAYGAGHEPSLAECQKIFGGNYPYGTNKLSVLEDSQKITAFQTPIRTKVVNFNQQVVDDKIKYNGTSGNVFFATTLTVGHKYYMRIDITYNATANSNGIFCTNTAFTDYNRLFLVASTGRLETIFTAEYTNYATRCNTAMNWENNMCIDLTAMGLEDLTLDECKALFNAPSYAYTNGTDMQLLSDYNGALALVDLPNQYPLLIEDKEIAYTLTSGSEQTLYQIDLPKGKYLLTASTRLNTVESWFNLLDYYNNAPHKRVAGSGNNGGGLSLTDYIELEGTRTLYLKAYGYGAYTQNVYVTIVRLG